MAISITDEVNEDGISLAKIEELVGRGLLKYVWVDGECRAVITQKGREFITKFRRSQ